MKRFISLLISLTFALCLLSCSYKGTYDDGYAEGYDVGYFDAKSDMQYVLEEKFSEGYDVGFEDGYLEGSEDSDEKGYDAGYDEEAVNRQAEEYKSCFEIRCTNIDLNALYDKADTGISYSVWLKICEDVYAKDFRNGYITGYHVKKSGDIGSMLIFDDSLYDNNTLKLGYYDGFTKGFKDAWEDND